MNYTIQTSIINHVISNQWYVNNEIKLYWNKIDNMVTFFKEGTGIFAFNVMQLSFVPDSTKDAFTDEELADGIIECLKVRV